jgi:hypothetical protein
MKAMRRLGEEHPIEQVGERLREMMPWIREKEAGGQGQELIGNASAAAVEIGSSRLDGALHGAVEAIDPHGCEVGGVLCELFVVTGALKDLLQNNGADAEVGVSLSQGAEPLDRGGRLGPEVVDPDRGVDQIQA